MLPAWAVRLRHCRTHDHSVHVIDEPLPGSGQAWEDAERAVKCAEQHVDSLVHLIADARKPPPPVYHAFPDTRKVAPQCMGLLFFLYPEATGTFPLLRLYCCAAQQCLVPLGAAGGPQSTPAAASRRGTESWVAF